ncbi:MAG: hypothetical protein K1Y02_03040 [Candidatus Hydrogenedentes bacterium]|nr:hypothetical protein [Candidatus Hydrogenedentota bacterium]
MTDRFTLDGSDALEQRIRADLDRVREEVLRVVGEKNLTAILLGGSYGRGEGGVFETPDGERPYHNYNLFTVVPAASQSRRKSLHRTLCDAGKKVAKERGIDVEFALPISAPDISHLPYELAYMELKEGHKVLYGPPAVLSEMPYYDTTLVPLAEGARILLNHGARLLSCRRLVALGNPDQELLVSSIHRANMAMGDAVLFARRAYAPSFVQRVEHFDVCDLQGVPEAETLRGLYFAALRFKLRPYIEVPAGHDAASWLRDTIALFEQIHLWYERKRLNRRTMNWEEYMSMPTRVPSQSFSERASNVRMNIKLHGWQVTRDLSRALRDPFDDLMALLPRALYGSDSESAEREFLRLWNCVCPDETTNHAVAVSAPAADTVAGDGI